MKHNSIKDSDEYTIGLIGQGAIYQNAKRHLESTYQVIPLSIEQAPQQFATCSIILYCHDIWSPVTLQKLTHQCLQSGVALLPVYTQFAEGIIGPCVIPGKKGCTSCAELRKLGAIISEAEFKLLQQYRHEEHEPILSQPWLSSSSIEILTTLAKVEITRYIQRPDQLQTDNAILSVTLESLDCCRRTFLPLPHCPECADLPADSAEMVMITLQSCPKPDVNTYRTLRPHASNEQLHTTYVDAHMGLVSSLTVENTNLLPIASSRDGADEIPGTGCTLRTEQSKAVSILEAVERYAGLRPRSKRTVVRASFYQLLQQGQPALDPTTLGLHSPEQYEQHDHGCHQLVPYHHDLVCNWVWGYSFQHRSPILIPEHCAYYSVPSNAENPNFIYEVSNGCALGNCLEEAIFHGIAEVVERDAFLLTWYAQLGMPRLRLSSLTDPSIRMLAQHLEYHSGYSLYALNTTLDHALPCICLLGVDEQNREGIPKAHVVSGSHPHPEQALLRALRELTASLDTSIQSYRDKRPQALEMLANPDLVHNMYDHGLLYYLPEAFERLQFLCQTQQQTFAEAFGGFYQHPPEHMDLQDDLESLMHYYLKRGTDILVVDQTAPEHIPCGLRCVKVLMPGMLPMTFGQHNRRVQGFERLHHLPFTLGYQDHPLTEAEINPHPHPFI